ncbi:MAG: transcription-repair coupling factor [Bacteroidales bacterium]|nr:transcription-repair coupling factor [Bacteroidales bacterium]
MSPKELIALFHFGASFEQLLCFLKNETHGKWWLSGLNGSALALRAAAVWSEHQGIHLFILPDKETAGYFYNDLEQLFEETKMPFEKRRILFFPKSYKRFYRVEEQENANVVLRAEVLRKISSLGKQLAIVTYPEALNEKVISLKQLRNDCINLRVSEKLDTETLYHLLEEIRFERVDFVTTPGQFSVRGGVADIFSFGNDHPYRIEFFDDEIESIRTFNPSTQLSIESLKTAVIVPNIQDVDAVEKQVPFWDFLPDRSVIWINDVQYTSEVLDHLMKEAQKTFETLTGNVKHLNPIALYSTGQEFLKAVSRFRLLQFGNQNLIKGDEIAFHTIAQPEFNKNFKLLAKTLTEHQQKKIPTLFFSETPSQIKRLKAILEDAEFSEIPLQIDNFPMETFALHGGFVDEDIPIACFTDHQIFGRYQRVKLRDNMSGREAMTIKELYELKRGDYVTHVDHGIGQFDGLEVIDNNGRKQETARILYQNHAVLYVSIHSLHRISKFVGKDGTPPTLSRLGSQAWQQAKNKAKSQVKDIARELIQLYAKRKASKGFAFTPDTYLQHALEASFIYEDTPDQLKATQLVKKDMESEAPMDRLICGDVGFGKTEVAIRACFKAVADSKQAAVLVPTTILAFQHYNTFKDRLGDLPCRVEYISRFKTSKQIKNTLQDVKAGKVDILIGTHRLLGKDVEFKDLGLLVVDEEQKFGVAAKEKLKNLKVNVDTITLTATPIPRTLQFSMMGARDLSVINTPPMNRQPVQTELHTFGEEIIRDAILAEVSRGGQVFFINNRIQNIKEVAGLIQRLCPDVRIAIGHGQMDGKVLEEIMQDFIDERYDVLVCTSIVESGLDIPNVNTIIINDAHHFGLSDLHQLRGRVGRSDKRAFCYLLAPPLSVLTDEARKRLQTIEEFSNLGGGLYIALRDLDIRGAGNILGAEQSGFISTIGFEMYQKILNEAITELKLEEFSELYKDDKDNSEQIFVADCAVETDMEIMLPDDYVENSQERLSLYRELDKVEDEIALKGFIDRLRDRFGVIPPQAVGLFDAIRMRWEAKTLGMERIALKQQKMVIWFVANQNSDFYNSSLFMNIIAYIQKHPKGCSMKESNGKLSLVINNIKDVGTGLWWIRDVKNGQEKSILEGQ